MTLHIFKPPRRRRRVDAYTLQGRILAAGALALMACLLAFDLGAHGFVWQIGHALLSPSCTTPADCRQGELAPVFQTKAARRREIARGAAGYPQ